MTDSEISDLDGLEELLDGDVVENSDTTVGAEPIETTVVAKLRTDSPRVDLFLHGQLPEQSRSTLQRLIESGSVTINGKVAKCSTKVRHDDVIVYRKPPPSHPAPVPEEIPLEILYQDEYLAVINKPYNMVVHPAKGHWSGTLVNALRFHFPHLSGINGDYRAGIVHRLDRDTSGAILIAKEERTHKDLSMAFEKRKVFKEYITIVGGILDRDSDYVEARIGMHPHDRLKMMTSMREDFGKDALSYYEVEERYQGYTLVRVQPRTGRTHQIRVHLGHIGHHVLADKNYSGRDKITLGDIAGYEEPEADTVLLFRQALHAYRLRFTHPRRDEVISIEAPIPNDMLQTMAALRKYRPYRQGPFAPGLNLGNGR